MRTTTIINGVRYAGTPGLYELIKNLFKRSLDDLLYKEDDMNKYKSMQLAMNVHKHKHQSQGQLLSSKGYKYVIAPLMSTPKKQKKFGKGLPHAMILNDAAINYMHWDNAIPTSWWIVYDCSMHRASNNAHNNEMLSIIEKVHEVGLIIN